MGIESHLPPEVSQVLEQTGTKFRRLPPCFRVKLFNGGIGDFVDRPVQLKIQNGGRKVGKNGNVCISVFIAVITTIVRPIST